MIFSHRNGETNYPLEPGGYWTRHSRSRELGLVIISQADIDWVYKWTGRIKTDYALSEIEYYGPVPEPEFEDGVT